VAFDRALAALAVETEALMQTVATAAPKELTRRCAVDVAELHDRLVKTLWSQEATERRETFERQLARAVATLAEVRTTAPDLAGRVASVEAAMEAVATVWRSS
jgi:hypothetical protein